MPTSKETRVRVEGLSNTIARTLPSSGRSFAFSPLRRLALMLEADVQEMPDLGAGKIAEIEEVTGLH